MRPEGALGRALRRGTSVLRGLGGRLRRAAGGRAGGGFVVEPGSELTLGAGAVIADCRITLRNGSQLMVGAGASLRGCTITLDRGRAQIGADSILGTAAHERPEISISDGSLRIADHCVIRATIVVRFGGEVTIGSYTAINQGAVIRCDERVTIGAYDMISYECLIFDTNTHAMLDPTARRARTRAEFPQIGGEHERPITRPVTIGDDAWLGQRSILLKGASVGDRAIVGAGAVVTGEVPADHLAVGNPARVALRREP